MTWTLSKIKAGDRVVVRAKEEILATLDSSGCVEGMPFMPQMLRFCGTEHVVEAVAHKTCDTACRTGGRKLDRMVHLRSARCDGSAHGGCEADCNLFWREEWLQPVGSQRQSAERPTGRAAACTENRLGELTREPGGEGQAVAYRCQATQLFAASRPLAWWNLRQYVPDVTTGNFKAGYAARILFLAVLSHLLKLPVGYRLFRALYDGVHRRLNGKPAPQVAGQVHSGESTPSAPLDLQPGEWVRVRQPAEIAATLNAANKNRGMWFGPEQEPFCGETFRVRRRVTRIIDERTGQMLTMRTPCITLEGVVCPAHYSEQRLLCPRAITPYWRENWLERK
jgi:hypothetical protein